MLKAKGLHSEPSANACKSGTVSFFCRLAVGSRCQVGPAAKRSVKGRGLGKPQLFGDLLDGQLRAAEQMDGLFRAHLFLDGLHAAALVAQAPTQGLRVAVELAGQLRRVRRPAAVAAEQELDGGDQRSLAGRAVEQVRRGLLEETAQGALV